MPVRSKPSLCPIADKTLIQPLKIYSIGMWGIAATQWYHTQVPNSQLAQELPDSMPPASQNLPGSSHFNFPSTAIAQIKSALIASLYLRASVSGCRHMGQRVYLKTMNLLLLTKSQGLWVILPLFLFMGCRRMWWRLMISRHLLIHHMLAMRKMNRVMSLLQKKTATTWSFPESSVASHLKFGLKVKTNLWRPQHLMTPLYLRIVSDTQTVVLAILKKVAKSELDTPLQIKKEQQFGK